MLELQNIYSIGSDVPEISEARDGTSRDFDKCFYFLSFGVIVRLESDDQMLLEKAREVVPKAFGFQARIFEEQAAETGHRFGIAYSNGEYILYKNGHEKTRFASEGNFFKYLNSVLRLEVGEFTEGHVRYSSGSQEPARKRDRL